MAMRRAGLGFACCVLLMVAAARPCGGAAAKGAAKGATVELERKYLSVGSSEINDSPRQFIGRFVEIKDVFDRKPEYLPKGISRYGISSRTHRAFETSPLTGSHMLCVVPRANEEALKVLDSPVVKGTKILLRGRVMRPIGVHTIFMVEEMYRGWEVRSIDIRRDVVVTLRSAKSSARRTYTIPELGRVYRIQIPGVKELIYLKVELKEPQAAKKGGR